MRTFHIGGAATKGSEENRTYLQIPGARRRRCRGTRSSSLPVRAVDPQGQRYRCADSRAASMSTRRTSHEFRRRRQDRQGPGGPQAGKTEIAAEANAYAVVKEEDKLLLLIAQDQTLEVRNGAEVLVSEGDVVDAEEPIALFDPFSEPIICEFDGTVEFKDIRPGYDAEGRDQRRYGKRREEDHRVHARESAAAASDQGRIRMKNSQPTTCRGLRI